MCAPADLLCLAGVASGAVVDNAAGSAADSAVERLADAVSEAVVRVLASLATAWIETPTPSAAELFTFNDNSAGAGQTVAQAAPAVEFAQQLMLPITLGIMVIALTVAGIRMIVGGQRAGEEGRKILTGLVSMLVVSSLGLLGFTLLIQASDATASWILDNAIDNTTEGMADTFTVVFRALVGGSAAGGAGSAAVPAILVIVGGIVLLLISFVQIVLMILRGGLLVVMAGLLPTVAAAATTHTGMEWLQRYIRWAFALILYKPIAALIYAVCFRMLVSGDEATGDDVLNIVTGLGLLFLACMALPALMRIIAPAAAAVAGNAGAIVAGAAAGAAAMGAMAVPMLAGGGAVAAGGGAAAASNNTPGTPPSGGKGAEGSISAPGSDGGSRQDGPPAASGAPASPATPSGGVVPGSGSSPTVPAGGGGTPPSSATPSATTPNLSGASNVVSAGLSTLESTTSRTAEGATEEPRRD